MRPKILLRLKALLLCIVNYLSIFLFVVLVGFLFQFDRWTKPFAFNRYLLNYVYYNRFECCVGCDWIRIFFPCNTFTSPHRKLHRNPQSDLVKDFLLCFRNDIPGSQSWSLCSAEPCVNEGADGAPAVPPRVYNKKLFVWYVIPGPLTYLLHWHHERFSARELWMNEKKHDACMWDEMR